MFTAFPMSAGQLSIDVGETVVNQTDVGARRLRGGGLVCDGGRLIPEHTGGIYRDKARTGDQDMPLQKPVNAGFLRSSLNVALSYLGDNSQRSSTISSIRLATTE
jgi:hypothetical protein|tara:strand:- start:67232 stop:67546 length:315 start_codon:yes stop_codon:yes gene_type:complete